MKSTWIMALAALTTLAACLAAQEPEPEGGPVKERASYLPSRSFPVLKGKSIGLLVSDVRKVMAHDGRSGPPQAMGFSSSNGSYRWIYVPSKNAQPLITNLNVEVGEKLGQRKKYPALDMANAKEVKRWDIDVAYALVEVEVNDGLGTPATEGFVATKMTRLDGSKEYPLKVPEVVDDAKKRYQAHLKAREKKIALEMDAIKKKALKDRKVTGPKTTDEIVYLTWLPDTKRVKIAFRTKIDDGAFTETTIRGGGGRPLPLPPKKGQGKEQRMAFFPPPPIEMKVRHGVAFGVELGMAYEYDSKGKLVARHELLPQGYSNEIAPPPGGGLRDQ